MEMRRVFIVVECLDFAFYEKCNTPNMDSLDPHPAWPLGVTTRATAGAVLGGFLPTCLIKDCRRDKVNWHFFLSSLQREGIAFLPYINNGWVFDLFFPYISKQMKEKILRWHSRHEHCPTPEMIDDFLRVERNLDNYIAIFWCIESHPPFYSEEWRGKDPQQTGVPPQERRKRSVEFIDRAIKPLLELDCELALFGDHPLAHPSPGISQTEFAAYLRGGEFATHDFAVKLRSMKEILVPLAVRR